MRIDAARHERAAVEIEHRHVARRPQPMSHRLDPHAGELITDRLHIARTRGFRASPVKATHCPDRGGRERGEAQYRLYEKSRRALRRAGPDTFGVVQDGLLIDAAHGCFASESRGDGFARRSGSRACSGRRTFCKNAQPRTAGQTRRVRRIRAARSQHGHAPLPDIRRMIILDTNGVSEIYRPKPETRVIAWPDALPESELFITPTILAELILAAARMPVGRRRATAKLSRAASGRGTPSSWPAHRLPPYACHTARLLQPATSATLATPASNSSTPGPLSPGDANSR